MPLNDRAPTVLVTGATGTVGSEVVTHLLAAGAHVRALTRHPEKAALPDGVEPVQGELTDVGAVRTALDGAAGLFLLSPVALDELNGTLLTLDLARELGTREIVYLSVIHADRFTDPPHFAAKYAAERMISEYGMPVTSLRPGYYMQNDLHERAKLQDEHVYEPPLGSAGVLAVDTRDLGEVGARELLRRLDGAGQPAELLDVVATQTLTGESIAGIWTELLGHDVRYGGDELDTAVQKMAAAPSWLARDMRLMFARFERDGMTAAPGTDERLTGLLGRPMRSYRDFAREAVAAWSA